MNEDTPKKASWFWGIALGTLALVIIYLLMHFDEFREGLIEGFTGQK